MALANNDGAATGEVLRIATGFVPSDFDSTYTAFYPMAETIYAQAQASEAKKDIVSARQAYLRAASYYRGADFFLIGNVSDPRINSLWDQQLDSFDNAMRLMDMSVEKFSLKAHSPNVPGGEFDVIGRFFKAPGSNGSTPTVIVGSGYDGSQEESYHSNGVQIVKHGYNFVTYEGPGQPTVRRQQNIGFIPDWYNVLTPVVDYLANRSDVDMKKLALMGLSFGGTLAPIAASGEHRVTQVIAIDSLYSIQQVTEKQWPKSLVQAYTNGSASEFNEVIDSIRKNESYPSTLRWFLDQSLYSFNTTDAHEWFGRLENITMSPEVVANLPQPVFVAKGQDDTTTLDQPQIAYQRLIDGRTNGTQLTHFHEFKTNTGAGEHVCIGAEAQMAQVILDWLKEKWAGQ